MGSGSCSSSCCSAARRPPAGRCWTACCGAGESPERHDPPLRHRRHPRRGEPGASGPRDGLPPRASDRRDPPRARGRVAGQARDRPGYAPVGSHAGGRAGGRRPVGGSGVLHRGRAADARRGLSHALPPGSPAPRPQGGGVGRLVVYDRAEADYLAFCRRGADLRLDGVAVALDCAHGATYRLAPRLFRGLGARVVALGVRPDGTNINRRSGALYPETLRKKVRASGARIGLAFDGDGDRLITVDETGEVRDGDYLLAICARHLAARGQLKGGLVVTTVMANLGLDRSLGEAGIRAVKTQVGDRYVLEEMRRVGANLGGEQSGHLIFLDRSATGDGLISALQLLAVMQETGR